MTPVEKVEAAFGPLPPDPPSREQAVLLLISACVRDAMQEQAGDPEAIMFRLLTAAKHQLYDAAATLTGR